MMNTRKGTSRIRPTGRFEIDRWGVHFLLGVLCTTFLTSGGCGYMVGAPYAPEVRTVAVPIFENNSSRRGIEVQLTEAVQKEIQARTPFHLANEPYADTRLIGRIVQVNKRVLGQTGFDDPRELQVSLAVEIKWEDTRNSRVIAESHVPFAAEATHLSAEASFAPEIGQSLATANQTMVDDMARQIVNKMETPW